MSLLMQDKDNSNDTSSLPTLGDLLEALGGTFSPVKSTANVTSTAEMMKETKKAVVIVEEGELVGIFTPRDMMTRVVAKGKVPDFTEVCAIEG